MLRFLTIENFALIERLEIEFCQGLNLITGETGSGKSIVVDSVGLLVGGRASQDMVRQGFQKARVVGVFELNGEHPVWRHLAELEISSDDDQLVIRRDISVSGHNKVFVNGVLSTQGLLSEIGTLLADIHGQHDQQLLLRPGVQLELIDLFGGNQALAEQVGEAFRGVQALGCELRQLHSNEQERLQRVDTLRYQIAEIDSLGLSPGLDTALEEERALLASAEKRLEMAQKAYHLLYDSEGACLSLVGESQVQLERLAELDHQHEPWAEKLRELGYQLEEVAFQMRDYVGGIAFDPQRLEGLEERLADIQKARRKYSATVDGILDYQKQIQSELDSLADRETRRAELERRLEERQQVYLKLARQLSTKRRKAGLTLCQRVERELADLNMGNTVFAVQLVPSQESGTEKGIDEAEFLISANPGETPKPLARIASGGELSRTILALRSILSLDQHPKTLVFDEIDTGIGGRVASEIGARLSRLTGQHQVFCVTHLPQIASFAGRHFRLDKRLSGKRMIVEIAALQRRERVEEIARMMAGNQVTEVTRQHAEELLRKGQRRPLRA